MKNVYNLPLKLLETLFEAFKEVKLTIKINDSNFIQRKFITSEQKRLTKLVSCSLEGNLRLIERFARDKITNIA